MQSELSGGFDPQKSWAPHGWEIFRCCLLRTLMSYNGRPAAHEGSVAKPDLAAGPPTVSANGLRWTFTLKQGIHYGPPLQDVTVKSRDIIRALEREGCALCAAGGYSFYYKVIRGFSPFMNGKAERITGLSAPDDRTLVVRLIRPAGYLPHLFAMPATAPIPPFAGRRLGVAAGHRTNYGRFLVATGPYMFLGSENLDFSKPASRQRPVAGYRPGSSIVLVRNPSWDPHTDRLRAAFADRISAQIQPRGEESLENEIDRGTLDLVVDWIPPVEMVRRYKDNPNLRDQVHRFDSDSVRYYSMNLAQRPFDDVHMRRALNFLVDKQRIRRLRDGPLFGKIARHVIAESTLGGRLSNYDPYPTPSDGGSLAKAKAEVRLSKYDRDGDGDCDVLVACRDVLTVIDEGFPYPEMTEDLADALAALGITLKVRAFDRGTMYARCRDPATHAALCTSPGWAKDFPDAYSFGPALFGSEGIGEDTCCNYSLVGASPALLRSFGYPARQLPNVDNDIHRCAALQGFHALNCWAAFDRKIMEKVVPWVPYQFDTNVDVTSKNLTNYSFAQFSGLAALDRLAVA
jgi:peptide/nickel transport system substrate-binding protein